MKTKSPSIQSKPKTIKIKATPLTDSQIAEFVAFYKKYKNFPGSKIPCTISGKLTTCVGPWMKKKIAEFGGAEKLLRNYVCRGVLKQQRQIIKPVKKERQKKIKLAKDDQQNWIIPKMSFAPPKPMSKSELTETTRSQCLRPDIFLNNGRHCEGCHYFELCVNRLKSASPWTKENNKLIKRK